MATKSVLGGNGAAVQNGTGTDGTVNSRIFAAALMAGLLMSGDAEAECVTAPQWHDLMAEASPTLVIAMPEPVGARLATIVVGAFNGKAVGDAQIAPDAVVMILARDRATGLPLGQAMFGLISGGCMVGTYLVPLPAAAIGEPS